MDRELYLPRPERLEALAPFRAKVFRSSLWAGWGLLGVSVPAMLVDGQSLSNPLYLWPALTIALTLALLQRVNWRVRLRHHSGEVLMALGWVAIVASLATMSTLESMRQLVVFVEFGLVALTAAVGSRLFHILGAGVLIGISWLAPALVNAPPDLNDWLLASGTLVMVALLTGLVATALREEAYRSTAQIKAIRRQEEQIARLYDVANSIGRGTLHAVLPELVSKIGTYLGAEVGLVMLHDGRAGQLSIVSPIWTSGNALEVGDYALPIASSDPIVRAFRAGQPRHLIDLPDSNEGLLEELGASEALVVPLKVESQEMGVLVMADPAEGTWNDDDLTVLTSLAAPAALVVSQLQRYEAATETSRRAQELVQMKTDFVSVVSHELRTPLTSIIGSLATLARPQLAPTSHAGQELLDSARNQADRLRRMIEDLLVVSRIDNNALPQQPRELNLSTFIPDLVFNIPQARDYVTLDVPAGLRLEADPDHLGRIITNLVDNALKYASGSPIEIVARGGDRATIRVIDHGPGIPARQRDAAFARFTQLEPTDTRSQGGTGLGLSIIQGLAQQMGGDITLRETQGGGATFEVDLPKRAGMTMPVSVA